MHCVRDVHWSFIILDTVYCTYFRDNPRLLQKTPVYGHKLDQVCSLPENLQLTFLYNTRTERYMY